MSSTWVGVLGPVIVVDDSGHEQAVPGHAGRVLVALATDAGRFVSVSSLIDALWPDASPPSARKAVLNSLSVLRRLCGAAALERVGDGYRLTAPTDVAEIDHCVAALGRGEGVLADRLEQALEMWRGEPFGELSGWLPAEAARRRLQLAREQLEDGWADAMLTAGRAGAALAEIEAMVRRAPLREQRWVLLMRALGQLGRTADALRAFQRASRTLAEEAGLSPGDELCAAERALLFGSATIDAGRLPALIGRVDELLNLLRLWQEARGGSSTVVVVEGEAGVGKTRLASAFAEAVGATGGLVLSARVSELLRALAELVVTLPLSKRGRYPQVLAHVLGFTAGPTPSVDESARAIGSFLEAWAQPHGALVVVDDLHECGIDEGELLAALIGRHPPARCLISVWTRPIRRSTETASWMTRTAGNEPVTFVELAGLSREECAALLGDDDERLYERSGGNPLWALTLQRWHRDDRLPPSIVASVKARLHDCREAARAWAQIASLIGYRFDATIVGHACRVGPTELDAAIDDLVAERLIVACGGPWFEFSHPLVHEGTRASIGRGYEARLHHAIALAMRTLGAGTAHDQAHHLVQAASVEPSLRVAAAAAAVRAGKHALDVGNAQRSRTWYHSALDLCGDDDELRCDALTGLGRAGAARVDTDYRDWLKAAADLARRLGDDRREAGALLAANRVWSANVGVADSALIQRLRRLWTRLEVFGAHDLAARLAATEAAEHFYSQDYDACAEAVAAAERLTAHAIEPATAVYVAARLMTVTWDNVTTVERTDHLMKLLVATTAHGDLLEQISLRTALLALLVELGRVDEARQQQRAATALAAGLDDAFLAVSTRVPETLFATMLGDADAALARAMEIRQTDSAVNALTALAVEQEVARTLGRWEDLRASCAANSLAAPQHWVELVDALAAGCLGAHERARDILGSPLRKAIIDAPPSLLRVPTWFGHARLVITSGTMQQARVYYKLLRPFSGRVETIGQIIAVDPVDLTLALLAGRLKRYELAREHLQAAKRLADKIANPIWRAKALYGLATLSGDSRAVAEASRLTVDCGIKDVTHLQRPLASAGRSDRLASARTAARYV